MKFSITSFSKLILVCFTLVVVACGQKSDHAHEHDEHDDQTEESWKEMDDFHFAMAEAFHPYKDSANLEPAKTKAATLAQAAAKWADAPLPERADNPAMKDKLALLKAGCADFANVVQTNDSTQIGESLTSLHDLFHEIQDTWYGHDHSGHHH